MPNDHDWPEWLDEVSDGLQDIYWPTKGNRPKKFEIAVSGLLTTLQQIEEAYLQEEISERCGEIFKKFANTTLDALRLAQETVEANRKKQVDSPKARQIRREVKFLDDLSFLDQKSWPKRVAAFREQVEIDAGDRYIIDTLKKMPEVQKHLS